MIVHTDNHTPQISILIADRQALFREGLREILEEHSDFRVVGEASNGSEAMRSALALKPDVMLLDLDISQLSGWEVLERLDGATAQIRIVVLAGTIAQEQVTRIFGLRARGVLLKESPTAMLLKCIRSVAAGQYWMVQGPVSRVDGQNGEISKPLDARFEAKRFGLTARELEILDAVVAGKSNRQIAAMFSISEQTVKHHMTHIFDKVGVYNRLELALFAIHHGLVGRA